MIRPATFADIPELLTLAALMHAESDYRALRFDILKAAKLFESLMLGGIDGFLVVCERGDAIVGGMAGYVMPHWISQDRVAGEYGLFVHPEARGSHAAPLLLRAFTRWARSRGAVLIQAGVTTGVHTEDTVRLYEALGYERTGIYLRLKESDNVHRS